jgi:hypothetical protein
MSPSQADNHTRPHDLFASKFLSVYDLHRVAASGAGTLACALLLRRNSSDLGFRTASYPMIARGQAEACPTGGILTPPRNPPIIGVSHKVLTSEEVSYICLRGRGGTGRRTSLRGWR